jgi:hypothetical protein
MMSQCMWPCFRRKTNVDDNLRHIRLSHTMQADLECPSQRLDPYNPNPNRPTPTIEETCKFLRTTATCSCRRSILYTGQRATPPGVVAALRPCALKQTLSGPALWCVHLFQLHSFIIFSSMHGAAYRGSTRATQQPLHVSFSPLAPRLAVRAAVKVRRLCRGR